MIEGPIVNIQRRARVFGEGMEVHRVPVLSERDLGIVRSLGKVHHAKT